MCIQWVSKTLKEAEFSFLTLKVKILAEVELWDIFNFYFYRLFYFLFPYFIIYYAFYSNILS